MNANDDSDEDSMTAELESLESLLALSPEAVKLLDEVCQLQTYMELYYLVRIRLFVIFFSYVRVMTLWTVPISMRSIISIKCSQMNSLLPASMV